ncbi:histone lysine methyltransferase Set6 [Schizosaccharomyces japonicus yFS275]|uniref:Histone lysine methyltransferase Set6 n=1 Tax=Schizosaccharomyces japonicus (strain yFS275 / FY16936) TaxID=402676 RepID=B6K0U4_SCHJY|nr:histone lysine methyltransferase Set6 [Schizosaccharomyces japonicus yFS275]EEB07565.1 histone lysine methyltransferase Set6 [Schizosaccharomyces japonicus yFS275]
MQNLVSVQEEPGAGLGLGVTADIERGECLLEKRLDLYVLNNELLNEACSYCCSQTKPTKRCAACKQVHYCSKICQKQDWSMHKLECKALRNASTNGLLPTVCRLLIRLYSQTQKDQSLFADCKDHEAEIQHNTALWSDAELISSAASHYTEARDVNAFLSLFCKLSINAMSLVTPAFDAIGTCMDSTLARINHSCQPNCVFMVEGATARLVALQTLQKGDFVHISYVDTTLPYNVRTNELQQKYFFTCTCQKCMEEARRSDNEHGVTYVSLEKASQGSLEDCRFALKTLRDNHWPMTKYPWLNILNTFKLYSLETGAYDAAFAAEFLKVTCDDISSPIYAIDLYQVFLLGKFLCEEYSMNVNREPHSKMILGVKNIERDSLLHWLLLKSEWLESNVLVTHKDTEFGNQVVRNVREFQADYQKANPNLPPLDLESFESALKERTLDIVCN